MYGNEVDSMFLLPSCSSVEYGEGHLIFVITFNRLLPLTKNLPCWQVLEYKPSILLAGPFPFHIFIIFLIWTLVVKLHDNEV